MDERQLIESALRGSVDAQRRLYEQHVDRVYRLAYRMCGDDALAQDFTQESFLRAFQKLDSFRGEARFSTWLHSLATSVILNGLRKVKRLRERETQLDDLDFASIPAARQDTLLKTRLHKAIDELSDKLKAVFVMVQMEGFQHQEVAAILDIPVGTSKARLNRAKAKLRESLADLDPQFAQESASGDLP